MSASDQPVDPVVEEATSQPPAEASASAEPAAFPQGRRVFVGNLSYRVTWQMLKDHMRSAGVVVYANVFVNERGQRRGCGVVEYETPAEALNARETLHDTLLGDRRIFVREDREDKEIKGGGAKFSRGSDFHRGGRGEFHGGRGDYHGGRGEYHGGRGEYHGGRGGFGRSSGAAAVRVTVGNLPPTTDWRDLKDYFRRFGNVLRADVSPSGEGTLSFASAADAQAAVEQLHNSQFRDQTITVRIA